MQALVIIVNKIEYMESLIKILRESGIRGATIIDGLGSKNKGNRLLNTTSFLATIVESLEQRNEVKKIILSIVEKDSQVEEAIQAIDNMFEKEEKGVSGAFIFTLPINYMRGGELERHIVRRDGKYL